MSLTSCYRYILELPVATLNDFLRTAWSESDGAASQQWFGIPVAASRPTSRCGPSRRHSPTRRARPDIGRSRAVLHLAMRVEVDVVDSRSST